WFYDERGSQLFDEITRLEEYYPTRTERSILAQHATEIAAVAGCDVLVELGSGTSEKTRLLLDAMTKVGLRRFVPFDVSEPTLRAAASEVAAAYPGLDVNAVVGDFHRHLDVIPRADRRLFAFLGGTIGNLNPAQRRRFLFDLEATFGPQDRFLLGVDLIKDRDRLVSAYDDGRGVTAAFNRNVLQVLNRELGANFDPQAFQHVALWNDKDNWIEMRLRAQGQQKVWIDALGLDVGFEDGDELLTEISAKFTVEGVCAELADSGLVVEQRWTDPAEDFLLVLASPYC
ncbi:MAG TPA: L-histidine N(alpha)-methyltransferase, partial [Acidimicrobiales bacterium]|nr:L-histidine N(alpha)-methyltransferase [Acidimicrobiales bacterium]